MAVLASPSSQPVARWQAAQSLRGAAPMPESASMATSLPSPRVARPPSSAPALIWAQSLPPTAPTPASMPASTPATVYSSPSSTKHVGCAGSSGEMQPRAATVRAPAPRLWPRPDARAADRYPGKRSTAVRVANPVTAPMRSCPASPQAVPRPLCLEPVARPSSQRTAARPLCSMPARVLTRPSSQRAAPRPQCSKPVPARPSSPRSCSGPARSLSSQNQVALRRLCSGPARVRSLLRRALPESPVPVPVPTAVPRPTRKQVVPRRQPLCSAPAQLPSSQPVARLRLRCSVPSPVSVMAQSLPSPQQV
mmetsp:Transcript_25610/g.86043  ORF Transcript_25610/g.86043 Transcript_25610/m.86043 type:complete len:308 (-) Transcript_25610:928-1851(-)